MDFNDGIDYSEISQENINDETLISIVRKNRMLYVKTLKDYKNKELKHEVWKNIGEMLGCTVANSLISVTLGEQTEGRWIALRNIFTKKLREAKTGQPSGSGSKKTKIWIYFKQMSFLIPHISHRMQV
ncbi:hypothetical protein X777_10740 [Ooceraea biroi]|uniref:MADF domain-containing protein n=1 Tax=Ooceraea biroi TaxID=2015173 RepID=A0A026W4G7_OOCBI|nr:hypothetical protein X777_10740 [Ooceraea biroi]